MSDFPDDYDPQVEAYRDVVETDGEVLARLGTDGALWADECLRRLVAYYPVGTRLDEVSAEPGGPLHTWFANAIEAGRSAGQSSEFADLLSVIAEVLAR